MARTALITGVTGQDGAYLAELLLAKGYEVHGIRRRTSQVNASRFDHVNIADHARAGQFVLHHGDLTEFSGIARVIQKVRPDELYNLGAQSHVAASFEEPEYTTTVNALGPSHVLEALRSFGLAHKTRFYQASTSELFGKTPLAPQTESTPFQPCSPYATAKLYAYWITVNYREAYGMFACNGILFNHESPLRGESFVTRKITRALTRIHRGLQERLYLGNLDARRDWGHARDYVEAMWRMLQQDRPEDFVIATGQQRSVREFVERAAGVLGMRIHWEGTGAEEKGFSADGRCIIAVDPRYARPTDVGSLVGDFAKAARVLGWHPRVTFNELVAEMVQADLALADREQSSKMNEHAARYAHKRGTTRDAGH